MNSITFPPVPADANRARRVLWLAAATLLLIVIGAFVALTIDATMATSRSASALAQREDQLVTDESEATLAQFLKDMPQHVQALKFYNADGTPRQEVNRNFSEQIDQAADELACIKFYQQFGNFIAFSGSGFSRTDVFDLHELNLSRTATFQDGGVAVLSIQILSGNPVGRPKVILYQGMYQNRPIWCARVAHPFLESR